MGYLTTYELALFDGVLEVRLDDNRAEAIIAELREKTDGAKYAIDSEGYANQTAKWYESDTDLLELSKKHPDVLFMLSGEGEDSDDMWRSYFLNGKSQQCTAEVVYPPYAAENLK